jgi:hypothetical protein
MTRKSDIRLAWWLNLANLYGPFVNENMVTKIIAEGLPSGWRRRPTKVPGFAARVLRLEPSGHRPPGLDRLFNKSPLGADARAYNLAAIAGSILQGLATQPDMGEKWRDIPLHNPTGAGAGAISPVIKEGRIRIERIDAIGSLILLLDGQRANLVGQCPICGRLFERLRKDQECDTRRCRDADLKRAYRMPGYEETRKINRLVRGGMPLDKAKAEVKRKRGKRRTVQ